MLISSLLPPSHLLARAVRHPSRSVPATGRASKSAYALRLWCSCPTRSASRSPAAQTPLCGSRPPKMRTDALAQQLHGAGAVAAARRLQASGVGRWPTRQHAQASTRPSAGGSPLMQPGCSSRPWFWQLRQVRQAVGQHEYDWPPWYRARTACCRPQSTRPLRPTLLPGSHSWAAV